MSRHGNPTIFNIPSLDQNYIKVKGRQMRIENRTCSLKGITQSNMMLLFTFHTHTPQGRQQTKTKVQAKREYSRPISK
ncbi:hypothetical protein HanIR_Chr03g0143861 [Helianthus annuus]|nr:hypothetical protein HanIR_Chr03g0143861 [Helianthus annuus]